MIIYLTELEGERVAVSGRSVKAYRKLAEAIHEFPRLAKKEWVDDTARVSIDNETIGWITRKQVK